MKRLILAAALATTAGLAIAQTQSAAPMSPRGHGMIRADSDRDGAVTRAEVQAWADRRFARLDADRDGRITAAERQQVRDARAARREARGMEAPPTPPGNAKRAPGAGPQGGPNGDGSVTQAQFRTRALRRFDRVDANRDGRLDRAELAAMPRPPRGGTLPPPPADDSE